MKKNFVIFSLLMIIATGSFSQELPLILDKKGTFEILNRTDYAGPDCNFTKTEITANLQKINELVAIVRKNQVLNEMKGFDGRARIYTSLACQWDAFYGVPVRVSFEFAAWFKMKDGREARNLIEPPEWSMHMNNLQPGWTGGFNRKPDLFTVPDKKETIAPGIDVYDGECFVLYNPNRPDYWLPVTVKEAFVVAYAENKKNADEIQWGIMKKMLDEERAAFSPDDLSKHATMSGMLSRVGILDGFPKIMKANPDYWDKSEPKSDIQIITLRMIANKKFLEQRTKEYLQKNSISYHLARFEESLDVEFVKSLLPLISGH